MVMDRERKERTKRARASWALHVRNAAERRPEAPSGHDGVSVLTDIHEEMRMSPRIPLAVALLTLAFGTIAMQPAAAAQHKHAATQSHGNSGKAHGHAKARHCRNAKGWFVACTK